jgi:NAD(P)-dependent dehydrogenase (short-subunit alcohol dehydrogenase family)
MIIITGASRGIGKYLLEYFIKTDEDVIGFYRNTLPHEHLSNYCKVNIADESEIKTFIYNRDQKLANVILINTAGISHGGFAHKVSTDNWKKTFEVNTDGSFFMIKHLLPIMRKQNFGRIINLSSIVPQIGTLGNVAYAASKSALWGLTKVVANENASNGITANCLNLGYFDIGMISTIPKEILDEIIETIPQKRLGNPINIINAIKFLIESDYVTGTCIDINGGRY